MMRFQPTKHTFDCIQIGEPAAPRSDGRAVNHCAAVERNRREVVARGAIVIFLQLLVFQLWTDLQQNHNQVHSVCPFFYCIFPLISLLTLTFDPVWPFFFFIAVVTNGVWPFRVLTCVCVCGC